MSRRVSVVLVILVVSCLLAGVVLVAAFALPYGSVRAVLDSLAPDGSFERFNLDLYAGLRWPAIGVGIALLAAGTAVLFKRRTASRLIRRAGELAVQGWQRLLQDARRFRSDLASIPWGWQDTAVILAITALALAARLAFINRPLEHDEAYTVVTFASQPLKYGLYDYHLPNNHIFHTLLVHGIYRLFGFTNWAVRFAALLAGVLTVPALYLLARSLYDRRVAAASAAGAAALPLLVYFSTNARGYTIVMLLTLLILLLADYVRKRANTFAWLLIVILSALGFYTIPLFLFPFGAIFAWLFLSWLVKDTGTAYRGRLAFFSALAASAGMTALVSGLLYSPLLFRYGVEDLVVDRMVTPLPGQYEYLMSVVSRLNDNWQQLSMELPPLAVFLLVGGYFLSVGAALRHAPDGKAARWKIPLQLASVGWVVVLVFGLKATPWPRFLSFLIPLLCMWSAHGWLGFADWMVGQLKAGEQRQKVLAAAAGLIALAAVIGTGYRVAVHPLALSRTPDPAERLVAWLQPELDEDDLIVVRSPQDAIVWYYWRKAGLPMDHFSRENPFFRFFVIVDPSSGQTLASELAARGPDTGFYEVDSAELVRNEDDLLVYELIPDPDLIRKAYQIP